MTDSLSPQKDKGGTRTMEVGDLFGISSKKETKIVTPEKQQTVMKIKCPNCSNEFWIETKKR